jgi:uncharacterized protein YcfL
MLYLKESKYDCSLTIRNQAINSVGLGLAKSGVAILLCSLILVGCARDRAIVSEDNSVDYRSARSLPPLIKTIPASEMDTKTAQGSTIESAVNQNSTINIASGAARSFETDENALQTLAAEEQSKSVNAIYSQIINSGDNTVRLSVDAPMSTAWHYVVAQAKTAGISIFSRNVANSRMFIGCGDIPKTSAVKESSRWKFFGRDEKLNSAQYCSLKLRESAGKTLVSVLDTTGSEVDSEFAEPILGRLLN